MSSGTQRPPPRSDRCTCSTSSSPTQHQASPPTTLCPRTSRTTCLTCSSPRQSASGWGLARRRSCGALRLEARDQQTGGSSLARSVAGLRSTSTLTVLVLGTRWSQVPRNGSCACDCDVGCVTRARVPHYGGAMPGTLHTSSRRVYTRLPICRRCVLYTSMLASVPVSACCAWCPRVCVCRRACVLARAVRVCVYSQLCLGPCVLGGYHCIGDGVVPQFLPAPEEGRRRVAC